MIAVEETKAKEFYVEITLASDVLPPANFIQLSNLLKCSFFTLEAQGLLFFSVSAQVTCLATLPVRENKLVSDQTQSLHLL